MALLLFEEMVGVLRKGSQNNEGFFAVKETGAVLLSSIGSLMFASSSQARVDTEDSQVNLTGFLKNTTGDPLFSAKHRVRKLTFFTSLCFSSARLHCYPCKSLGNI